jgi:hypothetical protein
MFLKMFLNNGFLKHILCVCMGKIKRKHHPSFGTHLDARLLLTSTIETLQNEYMKQDVMALPADPPLPPAGAILGFSGASLVSTKGL